MEDLRQMIEERVNDLLKAQVEYDRKYPSNPPHETCKTVFLKGLNIENSFCPQVGEINSLFQTKYEKLYVWTHDKDTNSGIIIDVNLEVKNIPFWKNIGHIIWLALQYSRKFEGISEDEQFKYNWIYDFDPNKTLSEQVIYNISPMDKKFLKDGIIIKASELANLAPEIELLLRDEKAYTSLIMLCNSFLQNHICLICELSSNPYHGHLSEEPEIWEHSWIIPNMETAIVQACRCVEGILGQPPNTSNKSSVFKHKRKWKDLLDINPDEEYKKAKISYFDFYCKLFSELRNPSAHSRGNIHYSLEKAKTIEAQCFAAIIFQAYVHNHILNLKDAQEKLNFNTDLISRVNKVINTPCTK